MTKQASPAWLVVMAWLVGLSSCHAADGSDGDAPSMILGVSADEPLLARIARIEVRIADGKALLHEASHSEALPFEVAVPQLEPHSRVTFSMKAFDAAERLLVRRTIITDAVADRTLLVRGRLHDECLIDEAEQDVSCLGLTCRAGVCEMPYVAPHRLEDYAPDWARPAAGPCGAVDAGEPQVTIGWPEAPFSPFVSDDLVIPQTGQQGGSHFFLAVRVQGADPTSARTVTYGTVLETGRRVNHMTVADAYDASCSLYEIPFLLPPEGSSEGPFRLEVTVFDHTENAGHAHVDLRLGEPDSP